MIHKEARSALAKYIESIVCDESKWSMYKDTDPEKYPFRGGISYNGDEEPKITQDTSVFWTILREDNDASKCVNWEWTFKTRAYEKGGAYLIAWVYDIEKHPKNEMVILKSGDPWTRRKVDNVKIFKFGPNNKYLIQMAPSGG
tara:strand:+ start:40 stop:468 length:429 start_codon:yes stop_codon:yes gene_type:complete